eukprot:TRINITY_DN11128_c0_g1_i9.p1 TRINITY_DN11128_c0_g1~~TRINITY_DN11128_c0_g1_i9.p1  ORF type:complete len:179 (+),score=4.40 TRINITY_DN11128_c0_g1_i9:404-940(+)
MLNNFQSIMLNVYYTGFGRILDKQVGETDKSISLAQMFASGETLRFAPGYSVANTSKRRVTLALIIALNNLATTVQNLKLLRENVEKKLRQTYTERELVVDCRACKPNVSNCCRLHRRTHCQIHRTDEYVLRESVRGVFEGHFNHSEGDRRLEPDHNQQAATRPGNARLLPTWVHPHS